MLKNMNKTTKNNMITYLMVIVVYAVIQVLVTSGSLSSLFTGLLVPICTYIILAISLNLVVGFLGELSLGHAGFMCIGAFTSAFFSKCMKGVIEPDLLRFMIALLIGAVCAGIFGILIGIPVLRLNGDYLAIVTLAFGEIIKNVINVFYIGKDSKGFHFSMKDSVSLNMERWKDSSERTTGNQRNTERQYIYYRIYINSDHTCHCSESDQLQNRTRDHGDS